DRLGGQRLTAIRLPIRAPPRDRLKKRIVDRRCRSKPQCRRYEFAGGLRQFGGHLDARLPPRDRDVLNHRAHGDEAGAALEVVKGLIAAGIYREIDDVTVYPDGPRLEIVP